MRRILVLLTLLIAARAHGSSPQSAVSKALADCKRLAPDQQQHALYLTLYAIPEDERRTFYKLLTLHMNNLSREAEIVPPAILDNSLLRVDIREYGWKKATINLLADVDPYFHVKLRNEVVLVPAVPVVAPIVVPAPGTRAKANRDVPAFREDDPTVKRGDIGQGDDFEVVRADKEGQKLLVKTGVGNVWVTASDFSALGATVAVSVTPVQQKQDKPQQTVTAAAPWLPAKEIAELITLTQSQAPILRADWFFLQTARQVDRNNQTAIGYYQFLGIKKEADIEELAGLDRKTAERLRRELAAIIPKSTVTLHNRQIFALQPGYWESRDVDNDANDKNAVRQLDKDYKFIAKEVYFRLPNDLWGFAAVNAANGELANSVPDSIASDGQSTSTDRRVHPGPISCARCHTTGLQPLDDWARRFYARREGAVLTSVDYNTLKRLRQLYLGPLQDRYEDDQRVYARVLARVTGWEPKEAARLYKNAWRQWGEDDVTGKQAAAELGIEHEDMLRAFKAYAASNALKQIDPVLLSFLKQPEFPVRREHFEEIAPIAFQAVFAYENAKKKGP